MLLTALATVAFAGTPVEDLQAILRTEEGRRYTTAAVCTPLEPVLQPMGALLLLLGVPEDFHESEAFLDLGRLLDPDTAASQGVALDGTLMVGAHGDGGPAMAAIPFSGDAAAAQALLASSGTPVVSVAEGTWELHPEEGAALRVQQLRDHLVFRRAGTGPSEPAEPTPWLLRGLPGASGCALFVDAPEGLLDRLPPTRAVALLPDRSGQDARVRVASPDEIPRFFALRSGPTLGWGSSSEAPLAVLTVNVPGLELLGVPPVSQVLGLDPQERQALESIVRVEPGLTVAGFGSQEVPGAVATLGVTRPQGRPFSAGGLNRKLVRLLGDLDIPAIRLGRRSFAVELEGTPLYGATGRGRLALGTDPIVVAESIVGRGDTWLDDEFRAWSSGRPLALAVSDDVVAGGLQAGLTSTDRTWDLTVRTDGAAVEVLDTVVALVSPAYVSLRSRARSMELERLMPSLREAEEDHRDRTGHYLALPPTPRPLAHLSAKAVRWVGGPGWDDLPFEPPEDVRGTYWVEIDEEGQVLVHGALDADGDGEPAVWTLDDEGLEVESSD